MTPKPSDEIKIKKSKNPITGLINVTGEPDTGKTIFALTSGAAPERTVFIDDDVKGRSTVQEVIANGRQFGMYHNLVDETKGLRELDFHKYCLSIIDSIEPNKYDVLIWDTWTHFENTFQPMVKNDPKKFREFYSAMGQIKGAEEWQASFDYEASILAQLVNLVPLVIVTSHLKKDATRVRDIAESKKPLIYKSRMRVWLRHSSNSPVPTGLMLKRLSKTEITNEGLGYINVTHRKVKDFTWKHLLELWNNPVGNSQPSEDEQLNESDLSILDGVLTRDQKDALRLAVIDAEKEAEEQKALAELMKGYPSTGIELITKATSELGMKGDEISKALGLQSISEVIGTFKSEYWEQLKREKGK